MSAKRVALIVMGAMVWSIFLCLTAFYIGLEHHLMVIPDTDSMERDVRARFHDSGLLFKGCSLSLGHAGQKESSIQLGDMRVRAR